jgi:hypothetical protein
MTFKATSINLADKARIVEARVKQRIFNEQQALINMERKFFCSYCGGSQTRKIDRITGYDLLAGLVLLIAGGIVFDNTFTAYFRAFMLGFGSFLGFYLWKMAMESRRDLKIKCRDCNWTSYPSK